jgi:hypothetical protein
MNGETRMTVTMTDINGHSMRVHLPAEVWRGNVEIGTGVWLRAVYVGPQSGRVIVETYSQWVTRNGCCEGTRYHEADADERATLARRDRKIAAAIDATHPPATID